MALTKGFGQSSAMTPLDARFYTSGILQKNADNSTRLGQLWGGPSAVAPTSTMAVSIPDGTYWAVSRSAGDGAVILASVGATSVTLPAAPASNSRYDLVWLKQNDATQGDSDSLPTLGYTSGTAAASPTVPAAPTGALALASVLIPSGVTATNAGGVVVTNLYKFAAVSGAPIRYRSVAEMRADAATVVDGSQAYVKGGGNYWIRSGSAVRSDATTFGILTGSGSMSSGTTNVTIPATAGTQFTSDSTVIAVSGSGASFTAAYAGYYEVSAAVNWGASTSGERYIEATVNLSSVSGVRVTDRRPAGASTGASGDATLSGILFLNAGDVVNLRGWQNSGGALAYAMRLGIKILAAS